MKAETMLICLTIFILIITSILLFCLAEVKMDVANDMNEIKVQIDELNEKLNVLDERVSNLEKTILGGECDDR